MRYSERLLLALLALSGLCTGVANAQYSETTETKPAWAGQATLPEAGNSASFMPEWVSLARKGLQLRRSGKLEEAASAFQPAIAQLKVLESNSDPSLIQLGLVRIDTLIGYGDVLNRLNKPDEAIPLLVQVMAIEKDDLDARAKRAEQAQPSMSYQDAMVATQATLSTARNMSRLMNQKYRLIESGDAIPFDIPLDQQLPETLLSSLLLADSYSRTGQRDKVLELYDNQFQGFLRRQLENTNPAARFNLDLGLEAACLRFALVLARVGPSKQQDDAFKCALDLNLAIQRTVGTAAVVNIAQEGFALQRRNFVGAYQGQAVRNTLDMRIQRHLVELIADSKGLNVRYTQRVRQLLFHSANPTLVKLRPSFQELEASRNELPVSGRAAVTAMVKWQNDNAALMRQALPELNKEGLGDIFTDGATLLNRAQKKLGTDALIGFSIYKPIDLMTLVPLAGRVLRYSVTSKAVEIQDIGTQKDVESLIYQWRSAVAKGADATEVPLAARLLGGLPDAIIASKSWVIDPDGAISLVPFEALHEPNKDPVIASHSVRYVTSIASFATETPNAVKTAATALVIANPVFAANSKMSGTSTTTRSVPTATGVLLENQTFSELPHTAIEAASVQEALKRLGIKSEMRLGSRATVDAMDFTVAPKYLHIATHGIYMSPGTDPNSNAFIRVATVIPGMQSALVFTPNDKGSIFTGADFARLPLSGTELVVLSACDTGNGALNVGEGVESLRMAVEEAGAKSSVTSLWPVPSEATALLMGAFYSEMGNGSSKADALRTAKLQLMKTQPDPRNWAGFLLAGQP